jgi:hypothetical protein
MAREETCTIRGLSGGRPLVEKIRETAEASSAGAPRPYTVSVGKAMGCSRSTICRAAWSSAFRVSSQDMFSWDWLSNDMDAGLHRSTLVGRSRVMLDRVRDARNGKLMNDQTFVVYHYPLYHKVSIDADGAIQSTDGPV